MTGELEPFRDECRDILSDGVRYGLSRDDGKWSVEHECSIPNAIAPSSLCSQRVRLRFWRS